jgi:hypothetical protein
LLHVLLTTYFAKYKLCRLLIQQVSPFQHVSLIQLLLIILSLSVQQMSPIQLLLVKSIGSQRVLVNKLLNFNLIQVALNLLVRKTIHIVL